MRLLGVALLLLIVGCSSDDDGYVDSPPAQCLVDAGYRDVGDGRTFLRGDTRVTLFEYDGVVQPVGTNDLDAYVSAGCL